MGVGTITSSIAALQQRKLGKEQLAKAEGISPVRPEYEIPEEIGQQVGVYRGLATQATLPGQAQMEDKLSAATSTGIEAVKSAGGSASDVISAASNISSNQTRSLNDLTIEASRQRQGAQGLYAQSLGMMGQYQDQKFNLNEMVPFMNEVEKKQALEAAGQANMAGFRQSISDIGYAEDAAHQQRVSTGVEAFGSVAGIMSDRRVKKNIERKGTSPSGIGIYQFEYIDEMDTPGIFKGAMADEVEKVNRKAVVQMKNGYLGVVYDMIDVNFEQVVN